MNLPNLKNERGVTLTELIVAMAVTSILMVIVGSGSFFVQKYLHQWKKHDAVAEELAMVSEVIVGGVTKCQSMQVSPERIVFRSLDGDSTVYSLSESKLLRNGQTLSREEFDVEKLVVERMQLQTPGSDSILVVDSIRSLYRVVVVVSNRSGQVDSVATVVRNDYEYFKEDTR